MLETGPDLPYGDRRHRHCRAIDLGIRRCGKLYFSGRGGQRHNARRTAQPSRRAHVDPLRVRAVEHQTRQSPGRHRRLRSHRPGRRRDRAVPVALGHWRNSPGRWVPGRRWSWEHAGRPRHPRHVPPPHQPDDGHPPRCRDQCGSGVAGRARLRHGPVPERGRPLPRRHDQRGSAESDHADRGHRDEHLHLDIRPRVRGVGPERSGGVDALRRPGHR